MSDGDVYRLTVSYKKGDSEHVINNGLVFIQVGTHVQPTGPEDLIFAYKEIIEPIMIDNVWDGLFRSKLAVSFADTPGTLHEDGVLVSMGLTGDAMPSILAGILSVYGGVPGPRNRGRIYVPPATEAYNESGHPNVTMTNYMDALGDALINGMIDSTVDHAGYGFGIWSEADSSFKEVVRTVSRGYWGKRSSRRFAL